VTEAVKEVGSMTAVPLSIEYPIETAGLEAQVVTLADSLNGDETDAPAVGVPTVMLEPEDADFTVMFSNTSACTFCPQHFTCRTCEPAEAETEAEKDVGSITAVPLSIE